MMMRIIIYLIFYYVAMINNGHWEAVAVVSGGLKELHLMRASYCDNQMLNAENRYRSAAVRSKVECVTQCRQDDVCMSVTYDRGTHLCHLSDVRAMENCSNMNPATPGLVFYQQAPPCLEGEVLGPLGKCVCAPGFTGNPCVRVMHDCDDMQMYGDWAGDGVYTVHPVNYPHSFQVYCRHITNTRMYILNRKKATSKGLSFDRPWSHYRDGFGDFGSSVGMGEFWLGLEQLYALTSTGAERTYKLRISLKLFNGSTIVYTYEDFKVGDEDSGYNLFFNYSFLNGADDSLLPLWNAKFSTREKDNDEADSINCAKVRKSGFWFRGNNCGPCNPFGVIYESTNGLLGGSQDEAFWSSLGNLAPTKMNMYLLTQLDNGED